MGSRDMVKHSCPDCFNGSKKEPAPWFLNIVMIHNLQSAGYEFKNDELTWDTWCDLIKFKQLLNEHLISSASDSSPLRKGRSGGVSKA